MDDRLVTSADAPWRTRPLVPFTGAVGLVRGRRTRSPSLFAVTDQVVAQMRDGLAVHDASGRLVAWNPAAAAITGWSFDEVGGRFPAALPEGLVDLGAGRWVDVRHTRVQQDGRPVQVTLFADARQEVALREAYARLNDLVTSDPLTGLPNRLLAEDRLRLSVSLAKRDRRLVAVLFVDLDRFKLINDSLGHRAGDDVLKEVARRLRRSIRESDTAARVGGDEFVVLLHTMSHVEDAEHVAAELMRQLEAPFVLGGHEVYLAASVGIAVFPDHGEDPVSLLQAADLAMYRAKQEGGNLFRTYTPAMAELTRDRLMLATELHRAMRTDELEVHYQPQIDIDTGAVVGLEALVRWRHPQRGLMPPDRFLPVAEETGAIVDIDRYVLRSACAQLDRWTRGGVTVPMVSVNFSARTLATTDVMAMVSQALGDSRLAAGRLEVEVSEHVVADAEGDVQRKLAELRALGVQVAIDDFGTGYSSLGHLKRFPLDTIKLDRSFVADVTGQPRASDIAVLRAVVTMAGDLGLRCVAEGVETAAQRKVLRYLRCHLVQGYLYGKPVPPADLPLLLQRSTPPPILLAGG
jgi:diguanylate cyclase (GGDEF)-like protein